MENLHDLLINRRSIRKYTDESVDPTTTFVLSSKPH